jgi:hypothetical protein
MIIEAGYVTLFHQPPVKEVDGGVTPSFSLTRNSSATPSHMPKGVLRAREGLVRDAGWIPRSRRPESKNNTSGNAGIKGSIGAKPSD